MSLSLRACARLVGAATMLLAGAATDGRNTWQRTFATAALLCAMLGLAAGANADVIRTVDPAAPWVGFINVYELPENGGIYQFGSGWGTADLQATFSGDVLTLAPNVIGDPNPYWYQGGGGPGALGNKVMEAQMYVETIGAMSGQVVTFEGLVLENTLVSPYTSVAFIKDYAPDYSSFSSVTTPLVAGEFSIGLVTQPDPARHVQYGFITTGPNVWITDVASKGVVQVTAIPEPAAAAALCGVLGLLALKRR